MGKIFSLAFVFLLAFLMTVCSQNRVEENGMTGGTETTSATDTIESAHETGTESGYAGSEPAAEEETIVSAEFDFETKTVMLNSEYEMPLNGLGTYSLHGDEYINSVKSALSNSVRLIDTASAYGNDVICCEV